MKTQNNNTAQKNQKQNQLVFIEYEKPTKEGHFMTIMDSYRNVIGRVNKSFNAETKKFEYVAFDHAGASYSKSEKLWEVKNEFVNNRDTLLEQAHQRRIESKEKSKEVTDGTLQKEQHVNKADERKNQLEKMREGKTGQEKQADKTVEDDFNQEEERLNELDDLRNNKDDEREDIGLER